MSPIIGNAIAILIVAVILFFALRKCIRIFKGELNGNCSCCSGGCNCHCKDKKE